MSRWVYWVSLGFIVVVVGFPLYGILSEMPYIVLGIQPRNLDFGKPMSTEVQQGIKKVAAALSNLLKG